MKRALTILGISTLFFLSCKSQQRAFDTRSEWFKLNQKGLEFYQNGDNEPALIYYNQALEQAQEEYSILSPQYLSSLTNKGYVHSSMGNYLQALDVFKYSTNLSFNLYAIPHVDQVQSSFELAKLYTTLAEYDSAESYLSLSNFVLESIPTKNKAHYDSSGYKWNESYFKIHAMEASLLHNKGLDKAAIEIMEEMVNEFRNVYPETYPEIADYQTMVNNLATYHNTIYQVEEAKKYALEYYSLVENNNEHDLIYALQNLGSVYRNMEIADSATFYWEKALTILNEGNYKNSRIHTIILNNLGELMLHFESYDSSIYFLRKSLDIQNGNESINPPLYETTVFNLAEAYHWTDNYPLTDSLYTLLIDDLVEDIIHNFTYLSENEKISFYKKQMDYLNYYNSFALGIAGVLPIQDTYVKKEVSGRLYDLQLTTKAIILNTSKRVRNEILQNPDTTVSHIYMLWEERKNQVAQALIQGNKSKEELEQMQAKIEENEKWLIKNSRNFKKGFEFEKVTWQQVRDQLKPGEAAVEMVRLVDGLLYGALVVTSETKNHPEFALVKSTQSLHLEQHYFKNYINSILFKQSDELSYDTYWLPILEGAENQLSTPLKKVYFSSDGIYNLINLNSLYNTQEDRYLLDETEIVLLTNTRELVEKINVTSQNNKNIELYGGPKFSGAETESSKKRSFRGSFFQDLPGTEKEVKLVAKALKKANWKTKVYTNEQAKEETLKSSGTFDVLHLASHGYFDPTTINGENSYAETMMGSGIVMAGINDASITNEDGLLSAFEILNMDLDSTELVVLSACETGKGVSDIQNSEDGISSANSTGVYGLQRAFRVAGAQNLIMSMWKVDDEATQKLMVRFYENWVAGGNMRNAFNKAQKEIREEYPEPYYWGAFVLAGR